MSKRPWLFLFNLIIVFTMALIGTSCEGNTDRYYYVANTTNDTIFLKTSVWDYFGDSISIDTFIEAQSALQIYTSNSRGGDPTLDDMPGIIFPNWLITRKALPDTLRVDWRSEYSWDKELIELSSSPSNIEHHYRFEVNENNFK